MTVMRVVLMINNLQPTSKISDHSLPQIRETCRRRLKQIRTISPPHSPLGLPEIWVLLNDAERCHFENALEQHNFGFQQMTLHRAGILPIRTFPLRTQLNSKSLDFPLNYYTLYHLQFIVHRSLLYGSVSLTHRCVYNVNSY